MRKFFKKYNIQLKLLFFLTIGLILLTTLFYFLIPMVLNYPANTYGTNFQTEVENTNYITQVLLIAFAIFSIFVVLTFYKTRFLIKYRDLIEHPENYKLSEINFVKNKLFTVPYSLFALNIIIPSIALTVIHAYTIHQFGITTLKLFILIVSLMTLYVTSVFIYTNTVFKKILLNLPYDNTDGLKKYTLKKRIIYNIVPILFASILFICLIGYTKVATETGDSTFACYSKDLYYFGKYNQFDGLDSMLNKSKNLTFLKNTDYFFVKTPDGKFLNSDGNEIEFSRFFNLYLNELSPSNNGRVYEYYGIDCQASTQTININGENYIIGIYFAILSTDVLLYFAMALIFLLVINIIILFLFSASLSNDINIISKKFLDMVKEKNAESAENLRLTSNDEIGELIIAFNRTQDFTKKNIKKIKDTQETLMEAERLSSLGQLIGGIAHNLKTPIMSISGAAEGLTDLVKEYDSSIDDPEVNSQDHHDIAKDMNKWIGKIKDYTSYMSDIITAVKGQAVTLSEAENISFDLEELVKRVDILMKHELKNAVIYLNVHMHVDSRTVINGDINSLVQVINNMISNAIQSYNGKPEQNIDLILEKQQNNLVISVKDYGSGLPKKVQNKLFKEMITTKGKNGTGLGLYMSYSTIKAHFNGDITFETEEGKGTTFNIILPL